MGSDQKIRICHLISGDLWAGAEVQMLAMARAVHKSDEFDVSAVVLNPGKLAERLKDLGIKTMVVDESKYGFISILKMLSYILAEWNIDILHTHRYKENILGALLKSQQKIKFLVQTVHGTNEGHKGVKNIKMRLYSSCNKYLTKRYFDRIVAVSQKIETHLRNRSKIKCISMIHNGIDVDNLNICRNRDGIRIELGIGKDVILIGSAGRMVSIKGYDVFLKMAAILSKKNPSVRFLLVGDGPLRQNLQNEIDQLGLAKYVIMPGFRDDIHDIMNTLDIFVVSSYDEGIPIALLEAMALGKAVVATSVGGVPEIINHEISGLLVKAGDPENLAASCLQIMNNPQLKLQLECGAQNRVKDEFSIDRQNGQMISLYKDLMKSI